MKAKKTLCVVELGRNLNWVKGALLIMLGDEPCAKTLSESYKWHLESNCLE